MSTVQFSSALLNKRIQNFLDRAASSPEFFARLVMVLTTLVLLILPVMITMLMLLMDIFDSQAPVPLENYLFEGTVLVFVFMFAMGIITAASNKQAELEPVMVLIAFGLVSMGGGVLGKMSNSCIPDQVCSGGKFILGLTLVTCITAVGYFIPRLAKQWAGWLGIVFLAVSVWSSELWLWVSIQNEGIAPTSGAFQGLFLLIYAMIWVAVFAAMPRPKPAPAPKKR